MAQKIEPNVCEVYFNVFKDKARNKIRAFLCNNRDCEPVHCTLYQFSQRCTSKSFERLNPKSVERWTQVRTTNTWMVGIAEIKYLEPKNGMSVTESCIRTLDERLKQEIASWENENDVLGGLLTYPERKIFWWIHIYPFFKKTFRQVSKVFIDLYELGWYVELTDDCIRFTDNDEVRVFVWDHSLCKSSKSNKAAPKFLKSSFQALKRMMEKVIAGPYNCSKLDANAFNLPFDLKQLLTDLDSSWNFEYVKVGFLLDRPLWWDADELLNFMLKYHHISEDLSYIDARVVFFMMTGDGYFPTHWDIWFGDEELGFVGAFVMAPTKYDDHHFPRFEKNIVRHFRKYETEVIVTDSQIAQKIKYMSPRFEALATGIRLAIMRITVRTARLKDGLDDLVSLMWSQSQLISSQKAVETRPSLTDLKTAYGFNELQWACGKLFNRAFTSHLSQGAEKYDF